MSKFKKRLTAPLTTDKKFISYKHGGYNTCVIVNEKTGYVLPNCVGYAHGRLLEILGAKKVNWHLPACNAEDWYVRAQRNGFKVGQTPKLGAVACWRAGVAGNSSDGAGHVAIVEEIKSNGDIVTSNSAWKGTTFYTKTITKSSGYTYSSNRIFQGFIYCGIEFDNEPVIVEDTKLSSIDLKEGDVLKLDNDASEDLIVRVNGERKFYARAGKIKEKICVKITDRYDYYVDALKRYF